MVRVEIGKRLTHLREQESQSETDITIFDTSLPPDSSTGLPPVKAKVKHRKSVQSKDSTAAESQQQTEANVERQTSDKESKAAATESKTKETVKPAPTIMSRWKSGLLCVVLAMCAAVGIKKYKRNKNK